MQVLTQNKHTKQHALAEVVEINEDFTVTVRYPDGATEIKHEDEIFLMSYYSDEETMLLH